MKAPKVTINKNGYEIRTEVLEMAKSFIENEYSAKFNGWQYTLQKDPQNPDQVITTVEMPPYPGIDKIMEVAGQMYAFVSEMPKAAWHPASKKAEGKSE